MFGVLGEIQYSELIANERRRILESDGECRTTIQLPKAMQLPYTYTIRNKPDSKLKTAKSRESPGYHKQTQTQTHLGAAVEEPT